MMLSRCSRQTASCSVYLGNKHSSPSDPSLLLATGSTPGGGAGPDGCKDRMALIIGSKIRMQIDSSAGLGTDRMTRCLAGSALL